MNRGIEDTSQTPTEESIRAALGRAFWKICELYEITQEDQAALLGVNYNRGRLKALRDQDSLPPSPDTLLRISHLVAIHKNLRILFSRNRDAAYRWMKTPRTHFGNMSALDYIVRGGSSMLTLPRLAGVRRFLDRGRVEW